MRSRLARLALGAYPLAYRRRYGPEMNALLEDSAPRLREVADLLLGALRARLRPAAGLAVDPGERVRASAVGILGCWILFAIAGVAFYKTTEDASFAAAAASDRGLWISHGAVQALAGAASALVLCAALPLAAAAVRRASTDRACRRSTALAFGAVLILGMTTAGLDAVVHPAASLPTGVAAAIFCGWSAVALGVAGACWLAARGAIFAIDLDRRALTRTLALGTAVTVAMGAIAIATAAYAIALSIDGGRIGSQANGPLGLLSVSFSLWLQAAAMGLASAFAIVSARRGWASHQIIR